MNRCTTGTLSPRGEKGESFRAHVLTVAVVLGITSVMPPYPAPAEGVASWPRPEHSRNSLIGDPETAGFTTSMLEEGSEDWEGHTFDPRDIQFFGRGSRGCLQVLWPMHLLPYQGENVTWPD